MEWLNTDKVATPEKLKKLLTLSDEEIKELKQTQNKLLKSHNSRAKLNRFERKQARGVELEQHHVLTGDKDGLAEALALQGRFKDAAKLAKRKDLKKYYAEKAEAVSVSDENCDCDDFRSERTVKNDAPVQIRLSNQTIESFDYSEKHKKVMPFVRCGICGKLNAKEFTAPPITEL